MSIIMTTKATKDKDSYQLIIVSLREWYSIDTFNNTTQILL